MERNAVPAVRDVRERAIRPGVRGQQRSRTRMSRVHVYRGTTHRWFRHPRLIGAGVVVGARRPR